jgi:hypothetical protein
MDPAAAVNEKYGLGFICVLVFGAFMALFSNFKFSWFSENRELLYWAVAAYLVGALATSVYKWYFYVRDARDLYDSRKASFLKRFGQVTTGPIPENLRNEWFSSIAGYYGLCNYSGRAITINDIIPSVRDNKERLIGWMAYWPFVLFWSIFDDILRQVWETMYRLASRGYQLLANTIFRGVDKDFVPPAPENRTGFIKYGVTVEKGKDV